MTDNKGMIVGVIKIIDREMVALMNDGYKNIKAEKKDNSEIDPSNFCHACIDQGDEARSKASLHLSEEIKRQITEMMTTFSGAHTEVKG